MHVYFVRHGETALNHTHRHQSPDTPLTSEGRAQMKLVAEQLRVHTPDMLIAGTYVRSVESADVVGTHLGLTPVQVPLFNEVARPASLYRLWIFGLRTVRYVVLSILYRNNAAWRCEDAENAEDVRARLRRARTHLESLHITHHTLVVVSHTIFTVCLVAYMCTNRLLTVYDIVRVWLRHPKMLKNGGVIHLVYDDAGKWRIAEDSR